MYLDFTDFIKYLIEGCAVALAAFIVKYNSNSLKFRDILILGLTASISFAILDQFAPQVFEASRQGAGFGLGYGLTGVTTGGGDDDDDDDNYEDNDD